MLNETVLSTSGATSQSKDLPLFLILVADTPIPEVLEVYGTYHDVFCDLFGRSVNSGPRVPALSIKPDTPGDRSCKVRSFHVKDDDYPSEQELATAKGLLITGSASSAFENEPWIKKLTEFTASLPKLYPDLKLIGICFGHQIMARAFGAAVERNPAGWEMGVRHIDLNAAGSKIFSGRTALAIQQMHRDVVRNPPPGFHNIASTPVAPIQGLVKLKSPDVSLSDFALSDISCLTLQGHPEFRPEVVLSIIDARERGGVIDEEMALQSREFARMPDDGVWIAGAILEIVGV